VARSDQLAGKVGQFTGQEGAGTCPYYYLPTSGHWTKNRKVTLANSKMPKRKYSVASNVATKRTKRIKSKSGGNWSVLTASADSYGALGAQQKATLVYSEKNNLNTQTAKIYSLNGVYDPNVTNIGHQPRGFDELMRLFDACVVQKTKVEIWGSTQGDPILVTMAVRDTATGALDVRDYLEQGPSRSKIVSRQGYEASYMQMHVDPNKYLGRKSILSDPDLKSTAVGNPTEQAYLHLYPSNFETPGTLDYFIRITYDVVFIEPKVPDRS